MRFRSRMAFRFGLCKRDVFEGPWQVVMVQPMGWFGGGMFHDDETASGASTVDDLDLEKAVDRFGQGLGMHVADTADRGLNVCLRRSFAVAD